MQFSHLRARGQGRCWDLLLCLTGREGVFPQRSPWYEGVGMPRFLEAPCGLRPLSEAVNHKHASPILQTRRLFVARMGVGWGGHSSRNNWEYVCVWDWLQRVYEYSSLLRTRIYRRGRGGGGGGGGRRKEEGDSSCRWFTGVFDARWQ